MTNPTKDEKTQPKQSSRWFTELEDKKLQELVGQFGAKRWRYIAQLMPGRTARQCRDRYCNYLAPDFYNDKWTHEEDVLLYQKFMEYGSQWAKLTKFFPGKNGNNIKNHWNYSVSRMNVDKETISSLYSNNGQQMALMNNMIYVQHLIQQQQVQQHPIMFIPHDLCSLSQSTLTKNKEIVTNIYDIMPKKIKPLPPITMLLEKANKV